MIIIIGGAARFTTYLKGLKQQLAAQNESSPLILFSGDFVGPSLMSSLTQGAHLIDAMNEF
jgi:2',3'-cyclic-nucleotide 2'-phosphodiesterase (5'-nucleotidase family)